MAEHFARGRDLERAVRFRTLAGENAARRFAGLEAVEHYTAGLQLLHKQPSESLRPLVAALHGRRAAAYLLLARFDEAARDYEAMLERAREATNPAAACEALSGLCNAHFFEQRPREMAARAREALQAAERLGSPHHVAEARGRVAQALVMEGQLTKARGALDTAISEAGASGSQVALQLGLFYRGFVHYWHAEFQACEARMSEALGICEERGDGFEAFAARMFQGLARVNQGRISEGLVDLVQAELLAARNGDRYWQPRFVSLQGYVHRELAAVGKARELDARALSLARENPSPWAPEIDALLNLCIDGVRAGDPEAAANALALLEDRSRSRDWFRWMNDLRLETVAAEHHFARGAFDATAARASRLDVVARRVGARNYLCAAARLHAEVALAGRGNVAEAFARQERARGALRGLVVPLEAWKSGRVAALLRRRRGDEKGARAAFVAAASHVDTIVHGTDDPALRETFRGSPAVREVIAEAGRL
jgi:tetratricopeptide (TPR) repeat protein